MIKDNNLIIGSEVLGAYLAKVLIKKKKMLLLLQEQEHFQITEN